MIENNGLKQLDLFFRPKSVAVIGASVKRGKIGHEIVRSLVEGNFRGDVYPVTLRADKILGLDCFKKVSDIPGGIDLVVYALPSKLAPLIIDECGRKGVRNVIIVSGGFKEMGGELRDLEAEIVSIARRYGIRIIGPNCIGVFDGDSRLDTFFQPNERMQRPLAGPISFITQSGTYGVAFLEMAAEENIGISKMVSYGNKADVDEADLIRYLGLEENTKVIAVYMEAVSNGKRFLEAAMEVAPRKPIVIMKSGRTNLGVEVARSHTGWLAGSYEVAKAAFEQIGVVVVETFEELYDCAKGLALQPLPKGRRIGMITNGAGLTVVASDAAEKMRIHVGAYSDRTKKKLIESLPGYVLVRKVVDLTGSATSQDYEISMEALLEDPQIDLLMPAFVFQDSPLDEGILEVLPRMKKFGKPILCMYSGGPYSRRLASMFHEQGIPFFTLADRAMRVADAMMQLNEYSSSLPERFEGYAEIGAEVVETGDRIIEKALYRHRQLLLEHEGKALLKKYGVPVAESVLARSEEEALKAVGCLGFPLVLKIVSPDVIHKSDVGAVLVGMRDEAAVREGYRTIQEIARKISAKLEGVLIQRMAPQGTEVIVGGVLDREFGPIVMFGLGGIFVEVLKDVEFRRAPITRLEAHEMIHEINGYPILRGVRKQPPADEEALADILVRVSKLMVDQPKIREIDLNPVFVYEKGATVADVRVILEQ